MVLFWCFTWRCFLSLRLQCDCVVYRAGFLLSHVKRKIRGTAIAATGSSKIVAISVSFANQLTMLMAQLMRNETACLSGPHAQSHHSPWGTSLYKPHRYRGTPLYYGYLVSTDSWLCPWGKKTLTLSMVPSVPVLLEYGFCTPTMNSQEYPPDTILTMSLDLNFSPWEKKRLFTARVKRNVLAMF